MSMSVEKRSAGHEGRRLSEGKEVANLWYPRPKHGGEALRDEAIKSRICRLYGFKYSLRELAAWFLISHEAVRKILKDAGVLRRAKRYSWKPQVGRETVVGGYIKVFVGPGFPGAPRSGWMFKHRLVMQRKLGRALLPWEVVHHIDRSKLNNAALNLKVLKRNDHPTCLSCPYYLFYVERTGRKTFDN